MNFLKSLNEFTKEQKESFIYFLLAYFFSLFNYPLIRSATTVHFFEFFGAKSSPYAWLWTVIFLSFAVGGSNFLQSRLSIQRVFLIISSLSAVIFYFTESMGKFTYMGYLPFIWKDIYIVLQIHLLLAFINQALSKDLFRRFVGPIGAIGSLGGVIGGLLTSYLSADFGTAAVLVVGSLMVLMPGLFFLKTKNAFQQVEEKSKTSPLASFSPEVKRYIFYIALMVAITQFIINIADFKFNIAFEKAVSGKELRTEYLGHLYSVINFFNLVFQFFFVPLILSKVTERTFHFLIPASYLIGQLLLMSWGGGVVGIAIFFVYLKASDYSFFVSAKEMLYQPLSSAQKYGAKYITDMLVYRYSKALIALVLIYVQSLFLIDTLMIVLLILWILVIVRLFQVYPTEKSSLK